MRRKLVYTAAYLIKRLYNNGRVYGNSVEWPIKSGRRLNWAFCLSVAAGSGRIRPTRGWNAGASVSSSKGFAVWNEINHLRKFSPPFKSNIQKEPSSPFQVAKWWSRKIDVFNVSLWSTSEDLEQGVFCLSSQKSSFWVFFFLVPLHFPNLHFIKKKKSPFPSVCEGPIFMFPAFLEVNESKKTKQLFPTFFPFIRGSRVLIAEFSGCVWLELQLKDFRVSWNHNGHHNYLGLLFAVE